MRNLQYTVAVAKLPPLLRSRFVSLGPEPHAAHFLQKSRPHGHLLSTLHAILLRVLPGLDFFDINALLGMYPLHLCSVDQLRLLASHTKRFAEPPRFGRVLDVGAGEGGVTKILKELSSQLIATETSSRMAERLRRRAGVEVWNEDISHTAKSERQGERFDMITFLNVLDRASRPISLLRAAHHLLRSEGWLLLSTPLPFTGAFHNGVQWQPPLEDLLPPTRPQLHGLANTKYPEYPSPVWEEDAAELMGDTLPSHGFEVHAFGRLPYISAGDSEAPEGYILDSVLILAKRLEPASAGQHQLPWYSLELK